MPVDSLIVINQRNRNLKGREIATAKVRVIADTWRTASSKPTEHIELGQLLYYLDPTALEGWTGKNGGPSRKGGVRIKDRYRDQLALAFPPS